MADKKKQELEGRKKKRKDKQLDDADLGTNVSGGSVTNVNYTPTNDITKNIKTKMHRSRKERCFIFKRYSGKAGVVV